MDNLNGSFWEKVSLSTHTFVDLSMSTSYFREKRTYYNIL